MEKSQIRNIIKQQKEFFLSGATKNYLFRKEMLKKLALAVREREADILSALKKDIHKPETESFITEISLLLNEIDYLLRHLKKWVKPSKVGLPLGFFPASGFVADEPYGRVLILGPWNYPVQLLMLPLAGAIAAGNCVVAKPSELAVHTSRIITELITSTFDSHYITAVEGGKETGKMLLAEQWDYIFFTGGTETGKIVLKAAAEYLTPVTLEMGGKCPCIVDTGNNLEIAARRISWGKFMNAGQTCLCPDYVYVKKALKTPFIENVKKSIKSFFSEKVEQSPDYGRIINEKHFDRIMRLLDQRKVCYGGAYNREKLFIAPVLMTDITWNDAVMQEEIFGPLLPVLEYESIDEVIDALNKRPSPLALYLFSGDRKLVNRVTKNTVSGSVCVNDVVMQFMPAGLPFGGVGKSGMGRYHGRCSFNTFSHKRSILMRKFCLDTPQRYPPYRTSIKTMKTIMKFMT